MTDEREVFALGVLTEDGHPSFHPQNNTLLTDTYPDKYSERKILLLDEASRLQILGSFFSPFNYSKEVRCDLHPRWDREGKWVCFDSAHEGHRNLYLIEMGDHE